MYILYVYLGNDTSLGRSTKYLDQFSQTILDHLKLLKSQTIFLEYKQQHTVLTKVNPFTVGNPVAHIPPHIRKYMACLDYSYYIMIMS